LQREIVLLQTGRAAQLDEAERELKRSGIFRNRRDDPIIRVRYLKELKNEPERGDVVSQMSLMIRLFIMFLEIAPVVAKMFFAPPSAYAWKIQAEVGKQQLEALVQLDRQIDEYQLQHVANAKNLDELIQERQDTKERARVWDEAAKAAFESVARGRQSDQSST
jgi:competence protein ComGC